MLKKLFAISVYLSFVFLMLLSFPVLGIFNTKTFFLGLPILYLYLFFIWALLAGILALLTYNREKSE
jgi:hypothetical protein